MGLGSIYRIFFENYELVDFDSLMQPGGTRVDESGSPRAKHHSYLIVLTRAEYCPLRYFSKKVRYCRRHNDATPKIEGIRGIKSLGVVKTMACGVVFTAVDRGQRV